MDDFGNFDECAHDLEFNDTVTATQEEAFGEAVSATAWPASQFGTQLGCQTQ
jgi:hypothetical protein